jgi:hypothetical protein
MALALVTITCTCTRALDRWAPGSHRPSRGAPSSRVPRSGCAAAMPQPLEEAAQLQRLDVALTFRLLEEVAPPQRLDVALSFRLLEEVAPPQPLDGASSCRLLEEVVPPQPLDGRRHSICCRSWCGVVWWGVPIFHLNFGSFRV